MMVKVAAAPAGLFPWPDRNGTHRVALWRSDCR